MAEKIDTTGFTDKASREERYIELYENNDYLTAYAKHTDIRVAEDPLWSIGRGDEWESHGELQCDFLVAQGLKPEHQLLDLGCGIGRAARKLVRYLNPGCYVGQDISAGAIEYAEKLAAEEGWAKRSPRFILSSDGISLPDFSFDFIWAHSVFTHLPEAMIRELFGNVALVLNSGGKFLFTYKRSDNPQRSGLKQFKYPFGFFANIAKEHGLKAEPVDTIFPAGQRTTCVRWGATAVIQK